MNIIGYPYTDWRYRKRLSKIGKCAERKICDVLDDKPAGKILGKVARVIIENSEPRK